MVLKVPGTGRSTCLWCVVRDTCTCMCTCRDDDDDEAIVRVPPKREIGSASS